MAEGELYTVFVDSSPILPLPMLVTDEIAIVRGGVTYKVAPTDFAGAGTVTSIRFAGDGTVFSSTPTAPVTTTGILVPTLNAQAAHLFLAGPTSGGAAAPTYRLIVAGDLPADVAYVDVVQTFTVAQRGQRITVTPSGSTFTPNLALGQHFNFALVAGANTIANPTNAVSGQVGMLRVTQSAGGGDTVTFGANFVFANNTPPTLSTGANAIDYFAYYVDDATHILVSAGILDVS